MPHVSNRLRVVEAALWLGAAVGAVAALTTWERPSGAAAMVTVPEAAPSSPVEGRREPNVGRAPAAAGAAYDPFRFADDDPFRFTHRLAPVSVGSPPTSTAIAPVSAFPGPSLRPRLALLGIVGGTGRWEAVLGGAPGHDAGALVRAGDTLGGLRVQRVTAESVIVQTRDTVWRLALNPDGETGRRP